MRVRLPLIVSSPRCQHVTTIDRLHPRINRSPPTLARTVAAEAAACPTLSSIVAKAKAEGNITVKNSPGRNLHRLLNTIMFISAIFKGLRVGKTLKDAVSEVRTMLPGISWSTRVDRRFYFPLTLLLSTDAFTFH